MSKILLIVGNGISIDLCQDNASFKKFNPQKPLDFDFKIDQAPNGIHWKDAFPEFSKFCTNNLNRFEGNNFAIFNEIRKIGDQRIRIQSRHFLSLAYSFFDRQMHVSELWKWSEFVNNHRNRISDIVSFNYDTIIERTLRFSSTGYMLNGIRDGFVSVFKPHGCSLMDHSDKDFYVSIGQDGGRPTYPLKILMENNDSDSITLLPWSKSMLPRKESYCILPYERNIFEDFQIQKIFWSQIPLRYSSIKHCLIIGHSYGTVDQPEIDKIIRALPLSATVHICNPYPSIELLSEITGSGRVCYLHDNVPNFELW